jgi:leucyl-tRNA synthetase
VSRDDVEKQDDQIELKLNKTILKVGTDIDQLKLNTPIAAMMEFINVASTKGLTRKQKQRLLIILASFAPYVTEELWSNIAEGSVHTQKWPEINESIIESEEVTIVVQINGKVRANITVASDLKDNQSEIETRSLANERVQKFIQNDQKAEKIIFIPGKIINFITK